jgi:dephospho-CoA kinase
MLKVGLTGGLACGKSVVGEMLVELGAQLIKADEISHQLMQPGQALYAEVVRHFGREILDSDGAINRARLAEAAFGSPGKPSRVGDLNRIVHPAVIRRQEEWMEETGRRDPKAVVIVEAALILEAGAAKRFDRLVVVTCRPEQRIARFAARTKMGSKQAHLEVARRMAAQLPDDEKVKAADYVIDNSGPLDETRRQAAETYSRLKEEATQKALHRQGH